MDINRIVVTVHPVYNEILRLSDDHRQALSKQQVIMMKQMFHNMGELVFDAQGRAGSLFVFVPTGIKGIKQFTLQQEKFIKFAQSALGSRFVLTPAGFGSENSKHALREITYVKRRLRKFSFKRKVEILLDGQFTSLCVSTADSRLKSILRHRNINAKSTLLPTALSIWEARELSPVPGTSNIIFKRWKKRTARARKPIKRALRPV